MPPPSSTQAPPHPHRWPIAFLLGAGVLVNYFDRVNLSVSHAALLATFGISNLTFGLLSGAYNWTYALCQLPVGVLLDRIGVRRTGRISTSIWALASFAAALAPGIPTLFGARLLLGIGEAPTFPANSKAIGLWFPPAERSTATATFDAAAKLASALGVPLLGLLLLRIGWRWSFAVTGLLSLLYFAAFTLLYRDPVPDRSAERGAEGPLPFNGPARIPGPVPFSPVLAPPPPHPRQSTEREAESPLPSEASAHLTLPTLLRNRQVLGLALGMGAYNYVFYLLVTWLPSYLSFALGIDLLHSFLFTGVPWLAATAAELCTAFLADALIRRHPAIAPRIRRLILLAGTTFGLGILGAAHAHTPAQALLWISLSIAGLAATCPVAWSVPTLLVPPARVGTIGGIVNFSNQLSGIAAPILTGLVVERTHSYTAAFLIAGAYLAVGLLAYAFLLRPLGPIPPQP